MKTIEVLEALRYAGYDNPRVTFEYVDVCESINITVSGEWAGTDVRLNGGFVPSRVLKCDTDDAVAHVLTNVTTALIDAVKPPTTT